MINGTSPAHESWPLTRGYNGAPRGCGGIGRRARFRSVWGRPRGGSSPLIRIARSGGFYARSVPKRVVGRVLEFALSLLSEIEVLLVRVRLFGFAFGIGAGLSELRRRRGLEECLEPLPVSASLRAPQVAASETHGKGADAPPGPDRCARCRERLDVSRLRVPAASEHRPNRRPCAVTSQWRTVREHDPRLVPPLQRTPRRWLQAAEFGKWGCGTSRGHAFDPTTGQPSEMSLRGALSSRKPQAPATRAPKFARKGRPLPVETTPIGGLRPDV